MELFLSCHLYVHPSNQTQVRQACAPNALLTEPSCYLASSVTFDPFSDLMGSNYQYHLYMLCLGVKPRPRETWTRTQAS